MQTFNIYKNNSIQFYIIYWSHMDNKLFINNLLLTLHNNIHKFSQSLLSPVDFKLIFFDPPPLGSCGGVKNIFPGVKLLFRLCLPQEACQFIL